MGRKLSGKATMKDVAIAAGCSQTTVSVILNRAPGYKLPEKTRRRVAEAAIALGYIAPSSSATTGRSGEKPANPARRLSRRKPADTSLSSSDKVVRAFAIAILSGNWAQDSTLPPDRDLMEQFGASRAVLRDTIKVLTGKGLLESKTRARAKVRQQSEWHLLDPDVLIWQAEAGLDRSFVEHLGEMRLILEPEAAALAAQRRTQADLDLLMRLADKMGTRGITPEAFAKVDLDFHLAVAATANNPFLSAVGALIEVSLIASLRRSWPGDDPGGPTRSAKAHRDIVLAIEAGDGGRARQAMRAVIEEGISRGKR
ncbi:MAG: FCD domain-containing protein [Rhodobacteraceae bacterium]|nr:FCD domain-containing protein [Paracoccaceae bacterium]